MSEWVSESRKGTTIDPSSRRRSVKNFLFETRLPGAGGGPIPVCVGVPSHTQFAFFFATGHSSPQVGGKKKEQDTKGRHRLRDVSPTTILPRVFLQKLHGTPSLSCKESYAAKNFFQDATHCGRVRTRGDHLAIHRLANTVAS